MARTEEPSILRAVWDQLKLVARGVDEKSYSPEFKPEARRRITSYVGGADKEVLVYTGTHDPLYLDDDFLRALEFFARKCTNPDKAQIIVPEPTLLIAPIEGTRLSRMQEEELVKLHYLKGQNPNSNFVLVDDIVCYHENPDPDMRYEYLLSRGKLLVASTRDKFFRMLRAE